MAKKKGKANEEDKKFPGVYRVVNKKGVRYGIDYYDPITGQRVKKILKGVTSVEEAVKRRFIELADLERDLDRQTYGIRSKDKRILFETMMEEYLAWSKENKKDGMTDDYRSRALVKAFKGRVMGSITPYIIEQYKTSRASQVAKGTVNKELYLLNQVFAKAILWQKFSGLNPCDKVGGFRLPERKKPGMLLPEEVRNIMAEIDHPVVRSMVAFAFSTGWRISEIRKLKWEDVSEEKGTAWIVDPKNRKSVEIELNDQALSIIQKQKEIVRLKESSHVFCKICGDPYKTNLQDAIVNAAARAGVTLPKRKRWHILRRTWASLMLQGGTDLETLRQLGNWKRYDMPMWYAESAGRERKRELLNKNIPDLESLAKPVPEATGGNREGEGEEPRVIH